MGSVQADGDGAFMCPHRVLRTAANGCSAHEHSMVMHVESPGCTAEVGRPLRPCSPCPLACVYQDWHRMWEPTVVVCAIPVFALLVTGRHRIGCVRVLPLLSCLWSVVLVPATSAHLHCWNMPCLPG